MCSACAALLGIDDGTAREDAGGADGASLDANDPDASGGDANGLADGNLGADSGVDATLNDADANIEAGVDATTPPGDGALPDSSLPGTTQLDGAPTPTGCQTEALDASAGVFVATTGTGISCTQAAPCATIQAGINRANNSQTMTNVYVQDGVYTEQLTLRGGVNVIGGWTPAWTRDCSQSTTIVQAPPGVTTTVIASSINGTAGLSTLTIESEAQSALGDSLIGIKATGANTVLTLDFVNVTMANAGDGPAGAPGDAGVMPTTACTAPSDGGAAATVSLKGPGADAGWFDSVGFEPTTGGTGSAGASGQNGTHGDASTCTQCVTKCSGVAVCGPTAGTPLCGSPGEPGCGGGGGFSGLGGRTGGSSVGLFAWDAVVHLTSCGIRSGSGGNGGAGGAGGPGASGSSGAIGAPTATTCGTTCASVSLPCGDPTDLLPGPGGAAGGHGGPGATGAVGGDGAGGDSFAITSGGAAKILLEDDGGTIVNLTHGAAGVSADGGNGASGAAATSFPGL